MHEYIEEARNRAHQAARNTATRTYDAGISRTEAQDALGKIAAGAPHRLLVPPPYELDGILPPFIKEDAPAYEVTAREAVEAAMRLAWDQAVTESLQPAYVCVLNAVVGAS